MPNENDRILELAKPLIEYVNKMDPYISVIVRQGEVEITRSEKLIQVEVPD